MTSVRSPNDRPRIGSRDGILLGGRPLHRLLKASLQAAGRLAGTGMVSLCLVRDDYLVHVMSTGLPTEYLRSVARTPIGVGCCGVAVAESRPVVVESIPCSRVMSAFQCACERHGLRAVWCQPLLGSDGTALGALAIYHDRSFKPSLRAMRGVEAHVDMVASAVEFSSQSTIAHGRLESRRMATRFLDVQEAERRRIAEELHDELIQDLVGVQLMLESSAGAEEDAAVLGACTELGRLVARLRELVFELRPLTLEAEGLRATAAAMLGRLSRQTGMEVRLDTGLSGRMPVGCERLAYRVIREAVQNIRKHAGAKYTLLKLVSGGGDLELSITDDGVGFDPELVLGLNHFGLASMQHQVESVGGSMEIISSPGAGTTVRATLPCPENG